jgi:hypothetical protein
LSELPHIGKHLLLRNEFGRTGWNVNNTNAVHPFANFRKEVAVAASKNIYGIAHLAQLPG